MDVELATVVHAYGIVATDAAVDVPTTGIGGTGVALLDAGPVSAVFGILPAEEYGDAAWREHADDPRWLTDVAAAHQRVLSEIVHDTDVLPLRLPAMYHDEVHLHGMLVEQGGLFRAVLESLHDHVEWAVHLYHTGADDEPTTRPTSGTDFFRQKVTAATRKEQSRAAREARVRDAYAMLADLSRQSVANPPQDPALSGRREPMLLNSAHLVCRRHESLFFAAVEEVAAQVANNGITVEVSGPWPPYNFVELGFDPVEARA
jgi:hypothetical protein